MTKRDKRLDRIKRNPKNVTKDELDVILRDHGFEVCAGKGSHTIYQHPQQDTPVVIVVHGQYVPAYMVKKAIDAIASLDDAGTDDEQ